MNNQYIENMIIIYYDIYIYMYIYFTYVHPWGLENSSRKTYNGWLNKNMSFFRWWSGNDLPGLSLLNFEGEAQGSVSFIGLLGGGASQYMGGS